MGERVTACRDGLFRRVGATVRVLTCSGELCSGWKKPLGNHNSKSLPCGFLVAMCQVASSSLWEVQLLFRHHARGSSLARQARDVLKRFACCQLPAVSTLAKLFERPFFKAVCGVLNVRSMQLKHSRRQS